MLISVSAWLRCTWREKMKRAISILLLTVVLLGSFTFTALADEIIITTDSELCTLEGSWQESTNSAVANPDGGSSWYTSQTDATAVFKASQLENGNYGVYIYLTPYGTTADLMDVIITASGKKTTITLDATEGGSGSRHWVFAGIYAFDGSDGDCIIQIISPRAETAGVQRASGVRFVKDDINTDAPGNIPSAEKIALTDGVPVFIGSNSSGFKLGGSWNTSSLKVTDAQAYVTNVKGAYAKWLLDVGTESGVEISVPKIAASYSEDSATEYEIYAGGTLTKVTVDFTSGDDGWYLLGKFDFTGGGEEYVKITKTTESGNTRAICLKLAINEKKEDIVSSVIENTDLHIFERMGMFTEEPVTDEYLDKALTRAEMAVMLTRLFGKTDEIKSEESADNFADVPSDYPSKDTLAYIKSHPEFGIKGHGKNSFSPESNAGKTELLKFILHQLGYYELTDYQPSQAKKFADFLGMDTFAEEALTARSMAQIIYSAFEIPLKNDGKHTLFQKIVRENSGVRDPDLFKGKPLPKTLVSQREAEKNKDRGIIYNNDGNDAYKKYDEYPNDFPIESIENLNTTVTSENFLKTRTNGVENTQVTTIFYCTGVFNSYTHTSSGETDTRKRDWSYLLKEYTGRDSLETMIDYGDANNLDVFWSMRMNDTHDYAYEENQLDSWKQANLDKLVSRKYDSFSMNYGKFRWSSVDYTHNESRQKVYDILKDTVSRYDIDGIELDFTRFPIYFKEVTDGTDVYPENIERMNDLMRMIRALTDMYSVEKNKPLLISIYVPDSIAFCRAIGLDIETWLEENLADMVTVGYDNARFQTWSESVAQYAKYGVPVYAGFDELAFESGYDIGKEAAIAWSEDVKGVYLYNLWYSSSKKYLFNTIGKKSTANGGSVDADYKTHLKTVDSSTSEYLKYVKNEEKYVTDAFKALKN